MIEENIEVWANSLTERVIEIKHFDVEQMKTSIATHIKLALHDCLKMQISETEKKLVSMKVIMGHWAGGSQEEIKSRIVKLKAELKEQNKARSEIEQIEKLKEVLSWMNEKHPESLNDFYLNFYSKNRPKDKIKIN